MHPQTTQKDIVLPADFSIDDLQNQLAKLPEDSDRFLDQEGIERYIYPPYSPDGSICHKNLRAIKNILSAHIRQIPSLWVLSTEDHCYLLESQIFESSDPIDYLCKMSGGSIKDLVQCAERAVCLSDRLPITLTTVKRAVSELRENLLLTLDKEDIDKLKQLSNSEEEPDQKLLVTRAVMPYASIENGMIKWFDMHPVLRSKFNGGSITIGQDRICYVNLSVHIPAGCCAKISPISICVGAEDDAPQSLNIKLAEVL